MGVLTLPELGENIEAADVTRLLVAIGDPVRAGQGLVEVESEKATLEVPAAAAGVVTALHVKPGEPKTVYDWIREARAHGARFWACPANLDLFGKSERDLIPECSGLMGAAAVIEAVMNDHGKVLTF